MGSGASAVLVVDCGHDLPWLDASHCTSLSRKGWEYPHGCKLLHASSRQSLPGELSCDTYGRKQTLKNFLCKALSLHPSCAFVIRQPSYYRVQVQLPALPIAFTAWPVLPLSLPLWSLLQSFFGFPSPFCYGAARSSRLLNTLDFSLQVHRWTLTPSRLVLSKPNGCGCCCSHLCARETYAAFKKVRQTNTHTPPKN